MTDEDLQRLRVYSAAHAKNDGVTAEVSRSGDGWFVVEAVNTSGGAPLRKISHAFEFVDLAQAQSMLDRVMNEVRGN
jgi:hypothetical protein